MSGKTDPSARGAESRQVLGEGRKQGPCRQGSSREEKGEGCFLLLEGPGTLLLRMEPVSSMGPEGGRSPAEGATLTSSGLVFYKTDLLTMIHIT